MRKIATYYFIALAILNLLFGWYLQFAAGVMKEALLDLLGGKSLPLWTAHAVAYPWWPYLFATVCIVGAVVGVTTRLSSRQLNHAVILTLALDLWFMFSTVVAYVLPWIHIGEQASG